MTMKKIAKNIKFEEALAELEQQVQAQSPTGTDAIQLLAQADQRAKGLLAEVFGPGNDFDAMLGGTNLLAVAGNGQRVIVVAADDDNEYELETFAELED